MGNKKISEFELAKNLNARTLADYQDRLTMLAVSLFSWKNLDKHAGVGAGRFLEKALFENGRACFVKDPELGFLALRANPSDKLNVYQLPIRINAWSVGYSKQYAFDDVVYIMNNETMKPTMAILDLFAYRLYECERAIDININATKTPILIEGDTKTIVTLKNAYMQYSGNIPFIFGNKQFDLNNRLNALKTDAPFLVDKLDNHKHELFNDMLTILGIDNANTNKRERLLKSEVHSNDQLINYYLNCYYKTRKIACDAINEKFLADVPEEDKVNIELNREILSLLNTTESEIMENKEKFD